MAIGDAALAAGMDLTLGADQASDLDEEINKTRDYIATHTHLINKIYAMDGVTLYSTALQAQLEADGVVLQAQLDALEARITALET